MHEIVTIQIGSQSNYVGTHFWNAQESYFTYPGQEESPVNHNIHFREGIGGDGSDTFTPRALIYDLKNAFGSLRRINELYQQIENQPSLSNIWSGPTVTQQLPAVETNAYQRSLVDDSEPVEISRSDVRFWSDFSHVYYHPRSIVQVYETELVTGHSTFHDWSSGEELFAALGHEDDVLDRDVRPFVEECDQMQGIQIFTDISNAWGGFTSKYLDRIRDEYGKLSVWVCGFDEAAEASATLRTKTAVNHARALYAFSQHSSIYIPVTARPKVLPTYISWDQTHPWHTSALQASGLESALLSTRLASRNQQETTTLDHLEILLNGENDHRIVQLSLTLGDTQKAIKPTNGSSHGENDPACCLFPEDEVGRTLQGETLHRFAEVEEQRGEWVRDDVAYDDDAESDNTNERRRYLKLSSASCPMPLPSSFPHIFATKDRLARSIPVRARLTVSSLIDSWAKSLERATRTRISFDEREELSNGLQTIGEAYSWGFGGSDDEENSDE